MGVCSKWQQWFRWRVKGWGRIGRRCGQIGPGFFWKGATELYKATDPIASQG